LIGRRASSLLGVAFLPLLLGCSEREVDGEHVSRSTFAAVVARTWTPGATMTGPRARHTATLLLDGRVLVAGGSHGTQQSAYEPRNDAELYDPSKASFEPVGELRQARLAHTATLLRDGRVLIVGGLGPDTTALGAVDGSHTKALRSAELYDPRTQSFAEAPQPRNGRAFHTATLLPSGDVLLVGGAADAFGQAVVGELEVYRTRLNRFESWGNAESAAFPHAAALMDDGSVLVAWPHDTQAKLELIDSSTGSISTADPVECGYARCALDLLAYRDPFVSSSVAITAPYWLAVVDPRVPGPWGITRAVDEDGAPVRLSDSTVIGIVGQDVMLGSPYGGIKYRSPLGYTESPGEDGLSKQWASATALPNGELLVAGGGNGGLGAGPAAGGGLGLGLAAGGGLGSSSTLRRSEQLVATPVWELTGLVDRQQSKATLLNDGRVLFTGGVPPSSDDAAYRQATFWDGRVNASGSAASTTFGTINSLHWGHSTFVMPSGEVLLAGGPSMPRTNREELFDPVAGTSKTLPFSLKARGSAARGTGGRLVFAGATSVQIVEPRDWSVQDVSLESPVDCDTPGVVRLASGNVAIAGKTYLFEVIPKTGDIRTLAPLHNPACDASIAALPDGNILVAGGTQDGESLQEATVFDPSSGEARSHFSSLPSPLIGGQALTRFGEVLFLVPPPVQVDSSSAGIIYGFDWRRRDFHPLDLSATYYPSAGVPGVPGQVTLLANGSLLVPSTAGTVVIERAARGASSAPRRTAPIVVTAGSTVKLTDLPFSYTWPENSSGSTASSATNAPIPVWFPATDGWPEVGTFSEWTNTTATWQVPKTPFPGLGVLMFARSGELYPLGTAIVQPIPLGGACDVGGSCESGFCADGVCCNKECTGECLACTAELKAEGADGVCGPSPKGQPDSACKARSQICGVTGICDGDGACAVHVDGDSCDDEGAVCKKGKCIGKAPVGCSNDASACAPYNCALSTGECLVECQTNVDCVAGALCNSHRQCETPKPSSRKSLGCTPGCYVAQSPRADLGLWGLGALGAAAWRRRGRARPRRMPPPGQSKNRRL
jgi:hypothetical protein